MSENIKSILKIRDDNSPLELIQQDRDGEFTFADENQSSSWIPTGSKNAIKKSDLRQGIEPWLTSLFQSEHLSLLTGTGLSTAIEVIAKGSANAAMSAPTLDTDYFDEINASAKAIADKNKRGAANIEDYIRVINELLRGLEILGHNISADKDKKAAYDKLTESLKKTIYSFADSISGIENSIAIAGEEERHEAFDYLVNFPMSFASRTGTRERLNIFTTNYDRLIEAGSELAGLQYL